MADRRTYEQRGIHSTARPREEANRALLRARILILLSSASLTSEELHEELKGRWPNARQRGHALDLMHKERVIVGGERAGRGVRWTITDAGHKELAATSRKAA